MGQSSRLTAVVATVSEADFVNLLRGPGIHFQLGGPVRQPYLTYRPSWAPETLTNSGSVNDGRKNTHNMYHSTLQGSQVPGPGCRHTAKTAESLADLFANFPLSARISDCRPVVTPSALLQYTSRVLYVLYITHIYVFTVHGRRLFCKRLS